MKASSFFISKTLVPFTASYLLSNCFHILSVVSEYYTLSVMVGDKELVIHDITMLLHLFHCYSSGALSDGLGHEPSIRAILFLADKETIILFFQPP